MTESSHPHPHPRPNSHHPYMIHSDHREHALICCDLDHGSSSSSSTPASHVPTPPQPTPSNFSLPPQPPPPMDGACPSPCPFETYCCLDDHCASPTAVADACLDDCPDACTDDACSGACFDPHCGPHPALPPTCCTPPPQNGQQLECCPEHPEACETALHCGEFEEWCTEAGCRAIQEYLQCCTDAACALPTLPQPEPNVFPMLTSPMGPPPPPSPQHQLDLKPQLHQLQQQSFLGHLHSAHNTRVDSLGVSEFGGPSSGGVALPAPLANICHWQNCHRTFETMASLLAHVAADHLGAPSFGAAFDPSVAAAHAGMVSTPISDQPMTTSTPTSTMSASVSTTGTDLNLGLGMDFGNNSSSLAAHTAAGTTSDLLSCLWDDCFPLELNSGVGSAVGSSLMPQVSSHPLHNQASALDHAHAQLHASVFHDQTLLQQQQQQQQQQRDAASLPSHSHSHGHVHSAASGEPFSPQTMLRHVLEEHLGVSGALLGWENLAQAAATQPAAPPSTPMHDTRSHAHAHTHVHQHQHSHEHERAYHGHEHDLVQTHAHAHPHSHAALHAHAHPHAHHHAHSHPYTRKTPLHGHHHHVHLPTPSPTASTISPGPGGSLPLPHAHICMWPGCDVREPFVSSAELMEHLSEMHIGKGRDSYRCMWDGCGGPEGRLFGSRQKVLRHLQSHTGHRPYVCSICEQAFSEAAPLAAHMRRHAREKPYMCTYPGCEKSFAISSSLTIHMRTHNGDKPFICSYCGKGFVEASNLTKHIRTHTGERPFACTFPDCGKRFTRPDQLKRHALIHDVDHKTRPEAKTCA